MPSGAAYIDGSNTTYLVACRGCGQTTGPFPSKAEAEDAKSRHNAAHYTERQNERQRRAYRRRGDCS